MGYYIGQKEASWQERRISRYQYHDIAPDWLISASAKAAVCVIIRPFSCNADTHLRAPHARDMWVDT